MVLGDLEAQIMDAIWARDPGHWWTVRAVYEQLRIQGYIAYTTVMNTRTRLAKKRVLGSTRQGRLLVLRIRRLLAPPEPGGARSGAWAPWAVGGVFGLVLGVQGLAILWTMAQVGYDWLRRGVHVGGMP